ncbi:hypothetical protein TNCV_953741 [Trichonephila clavipes]|nr:hypothetical protein TNCV_953741 [Trichonephila clavipes]
MCLRRLSTHPFASRGGEPTAKTFYLGGKGKRDRRTGSPPSSVRLQSGTKRKLYDTGASEINRLYPESRRNDEKEDRYLNSLPPQGGGWRKEAAERDRNQD